MSKDEKKRVGYLGAHVPGAKKKRSSSSGQAVLGGDYAGLRARLDELNEQMVKQNRDGLDAEYNVGIENLAEDVREELDGIGNMTAAFNTFVSDTEASFQAIAEWQGETDDAIAEISGEVGEGYAKTSMIASLLDLEGNLTAASIVAAVNSAGSSVEINADKIRMTGTTTFLTADDVGDGGSTEIAGNRISLILPGQNDDGDTTIASDNGINFIYEDGIPSHGYTQEFAKIYTEIDGNDSDNASRYTLNIMAREFVNAEGSFADASIKMWAAGGISLTGGDRVYVNTHYPDGYITMDAGDNTRIVANRRYDQMAHASGNNVWTFCSNGIYYGGTRVIAV